jgi:hypothetical protein
MRKRVIGILFCALLPLIGKAHGLDESLPSADSFGALISMLRSKQLPAEDFYAFTVGWSELVDPMRYLGSSLTDSDRQVAAVQLFAGLTPRQVILAGHQARILRAALALAKNPREKDDTDTILRESADIIRRYSKRANQSPEPTVMSVTPPAAQEPRQP